MRALPALALLALATGCTAPPPRCAGLPGTPMVTAELFFGRALVDDAAWRTFVADVVTPRFPDGFTALDGHGQWRQRATGRILAEPSTVIVVVAAPGPATIDALEVIRAEYRHRFAQESVGRALSETCAEF